MLVSDGNLYPILVNIQVSTDVIRVVMQTVEGTEEANNVVFANGVLNNSLSIEGNNVPVQVKMRPDGNIDVTIDYGGLILSAVGSRVVDGN
jgi:hypothetical protein